MSSIAAAIAGMGLGIAYFGTLWLAVIHVLKRPAWAGWLPFLGVVRLGFLGLGLAALGRDGTSSVLAGLGGLWLCRLVLLRQLGFKHHGA